MTRFMLQGHMKTVNLTPCAESKFPLIEGLCFFHDAVNDLYYFNATEPLARADPNAGCSIEGFFSHLDCLITPLAQANGLTRETLSIRDPDGNIFLEECLVVPFMVYVESWFGPYMVMRMEELLSMGITLSDEMIRLFYRTRFGQQPACPDIST